MAAGEPAMNTAQRAAAAVRWSWLIAILRPAGTPGMAVVVLWALAVAGRFVKSGTCFDLNYSLFQPDGNLYIGLAKNILSGDGAASPLVAWSRPVLSLLSLPSYALFGDWGMLLVPVLSLLAVGWLLLIIGRDVGAPWIAVAVFAVLTFSVTVNRWMVADLTDSPHAALFLFCFLLLTRRSNLRWVVLVVLLGAMTRPAGPLWAGLILPFALNSSGIRKRALIALSAASVLTFVLTGLGLGVSGAFEKDAISPLGRIVNAIPKFFSVAFVEFAELAVLDRLLLVFTLLALFLALRSWRRDPWSYAFLLSFLASLLLSAWIGEYGVNFRYQLPAVFVGAAVVIREATISFRIMVEAEQEPKGNGTEGTAGLGKQ